MPDARFLFAVAPASLGVTSAVGTGDMPGDCISGGTARDNRFDSSTSVFDAARFALSKACCDQRGFASLVMFANCFCRLRTSACKFFICVCFASMRRESLLLNDLSNASKQSSTSPSTWSISSNSRCMPCTIDTERRMTPAVYQSTLFNTAYRCQLVSVAVPGTSRLVTIGTRTDAKDE